MNVNFSRKELIKFILKVYLPLFIVLNLISYIKFNTVYESDFKSIMIYLIEPLFFIYPTYLLIYLKIKKFFYWLFIGVIPFLILIYIFNSKNIGFSYEIVYYSMALSNIMYPLGLLGIKTFKDYWEMSKEMTLFGKIGLFLSLIFIIISIIKRSRW